MGLIQETQTYRHHPPLETVSACGVIKSGDIGNFWPNLRLTELNTTDRRLFDLPVATLNRMGFCLYGGELCLKPINVGAYFGLIGREVPHFFLHDGFENIAHIFECQEMKDLCLTTIRCIEYNL